MEVTSELLREWNFSRIQEFSGSVKVVRTELRCELGFVTEQDKAYSGLAWICINFLNYFLKFHEFKRSSNFWEQTTALGQIE